jgi:hypothetical protein
MALPLPRYLSRRVRWQMVSRGEHAKVSHVIRRA